MAIEDEERAPSFVQKPNLRQDEEEDIIYFECIVVACPKPEFVWYFDNNLVKETAKLLPKVREFSSNRFLVSLQLNEPEDEDSGLYKIVVTNKLGDCTGSIKANFRAVEEKDP
ncbi:hypothetical protein JTE90_020228 [Oedothorax gibbosus]|uniref:Ig-like domain-containing protein n=1 Tax=Oedothorax gibbosus TaxID=931172 RepID=A0AAV6V0X1_9ARAC|nr:hypothetical protein JTE90_020228 [Oedothorax gibbosus]